MSILAEENENVNTFVETIVHRSKRPSQSSKWNSWNAKKRESRIMSARLYRSGLRERAARMYQCGDYITERISSVTGEVTTDTAQLCKDRLCPICQWRLSIRRFCEMMSVLNMLKEDIIKNDYKVSFLTLTVQNVELADLRKCIDAYATAWHSMNRRKLFNNVVGWSRSLEITYNSKTNTYHPHYHIILIWEKKDETALSAKIIQNAWKHAYKCDYYPVIDLRETYTKDDATKADKVESTVKAALEAFKYAVKPDSLKNIPQKDLFEFATAIKNVRFVSYGKIIKELRKALGFKNDDTAQPIDVPANDDALILSVLRWNGVHYEKATFETVPWKISKERLEMEIEKAGETI